MPPLVRVYDLRLDHDLISGLRELRGRPDGLGQAEAPLTGTRQWWRAVRRGHFTTSLFTGVIADVTWTGMADYPQVMVVADDGSNRRDFLRCGDVRLYVPGQAIRIQQVHRPRKTPNDGLGPTSADTTVVELAPSDARSASTQPGPGGAGHRHARAQAPVRHYLVADRRRVANAAVRELGAHFPSATVIPVGGTTSILVAALDSDLDIGPERAAWLHQVIAATGATYDGSELIGIKSTGPTGTAINVA